MRGPICDYMSNEERIDETIRGTNAKIHNESEIADDDVAAIHEWLAGGENCCEDECCY